MDKKIKQLRSEVLDGAPIRYAPANEIGVVFLFAHLAKRWRLRIDSIQSGFPDCIAYQKAQGHEKKVRIEFEFKSKNFLLHGHDPSKCDWIVCWEHNWPDVPNHLQVVELRREFGLGFNVWIMPTNDPYKAELAKHNSVSSWSLPSQCHKGDLILYYFTRPEKHIAHIFKATDRVQKVTAGWKSGKDYMGPIQRICSLKAPIFLDDLQNHRILSTAHFVRSQMRGRPNATEYWPYLYDLIIRRNPSIQVKLVKYAPENI